MPVLAFIRILAAEKPLTRNLYAKVVGEEKKKFFICNVTFYKIVLKSLNDLILLPVLYKSHLSF